MCISIHFIMYCDKLKITLLIMILFIGSKGSDDPSIEVTFNPPVKGIKGAFIIKRTGDTLNMTCRVVPKFNETLPGFDLIWDVPLVTQNRDHHVKRIPGHNYLQLVIHNLQESDSGEYTCIVLQDHLNKDTSDVKQSVRINVHKKIECSESMFACPKGCISKRYVCDGRRDCSDGSDEAKSLCGAYPCSGRLLCPNRRCIPIDWCCDQYVSPNCTVTEKCCSTVAKSSYVEVDPEVYQDHQQYSEVGFLQTTIYAVVGSAMAFMFVLTVLIIAICRIYLKRHTLTTFIGTQCPNSHRETLRNHRGAQNVHFCDTRPFLPQSEDLLHTSGCLVTYNINNGVQFVSRPVNPPPYCEVVCTPPREGPPPPYISRENLARDDAENTPDAEHRVEEVARNSQVV